MSDFKRAPRIEIRDFQKNKEQFSLFIQALINLLSDKCSKCGQDRPPPCKCGFHDVELGLIKEAHAVIERLQHGAWPDDNVKEYWKQAANEIRIPCWDRSLPVPRVLTDPTLTLAMPNGSSFVVDNVLLAIRDRLPEP